jgi:hypothetical protein
MAKIIENQGSSKSVTPWADSGPVKATKTPIGHRSEKHSGLAEEAGDQSRLDAGKPKSGGAPVKKHGEQSSAY